VSAKCIQQFDQPDHLVQGFQCKTWDTMQATLREARNRHQLVGIDAVNPPEGARKMRRITLAQCRGNILYRLLGMPEGLASVFAAAAVDQINAKYRSVLIILPGFSGLSVDKMRGAQWV